MEELYREYKKYQASLLSMYPRLQAIYNSILEVVDEDLIEVHLPAYEKKVCLLYLYAQEVSNEVTVAS